MMNDETDFLYYQAELYTSNGRPSFNVYGILSGFLQILG